MGALLRSMDKLKEAEPFYLRALEACERVRGRDHHDALASVANMGLLLQAQDKL